MARIKAPAFKLKAEKPKREPKRKEFKFKVWKPLPGQMVFREIIDNGQ